MKKLIVITSILLASAVAFAQVDIIASLDVDNDGRISVGEASASKEISEAFEVLDVDHDGYLTADELEG